MRYFLVIVFFVSTKFVFGQDSVVDSLTATLSRHRGQDTVFVTLLNELSFRTFRENPRQSFDYASKALIAAQVIGYQKGVGEAKNNLAVYQLMRGNPDASLEMALHAVGIAEKHHFFELLANSYSILGTVYHQLHAFDKAVRYLDEADRINIRFKNSFITTKVLNSRGAIARDKGEYDSALWFYNKALAVMNEAGDEYRKAEVLNNIGITYDRQDRHQLAMDFYRQSLAVSGKNHNRRAQALALVNIGNAFLDEKNYAEAEKSFRQSMSLAKEVGDTKILSGNYLSLMQLKNETGMFDAAHLYSLEFYNLKDSLLNIERSNKIAELEIRYETEKKEHLIALLERDSKIHALGMQILSGVFGGLLLLAVVTYFFLRERERKNRLILNLEINRLTSENSELTEKYKNGLQMSAQNSIATVDQKLLKKAIAVIEHHIGDPLFGVERMAKELGMSRTNMHLKVKAITGFPPSELIRSIRLRKAAALILTKTTTIAQVSLSVGFEDHSYFSKSFKKQFGVSPSEYSNSSAAQVSD